MRIMVTNLKYWVAILCLAVLGIYLFASAPDKLPDTTGGGSSIISAEKAIAILAAEQSAIRGLYTTEIVAAGLKSGLKFSELWKDENVHAGPLPALLLRETSNRMFIKSPDLSFFLGSDYPIVKENLFDAEQMKHFDELKRTGKPVFFYDNKLKRVVGMFPDFASGQACVTCHNEHKTSPKKDWKLNDIMGATTWSYTERNMSSEDLAILIKNLRQSSYESYAAYIEKVKKFNKNEMIKIGEKWPSEGKHLPDVRTFEHAVEKNNSRRTLTSLLSIYDQNSQIAEFDK
ncbi:MAG: hypothetical protein CVU29_01405 [Betaproteobacteria bacterium HGW-Betaproteobacteria-22]|nr:MAG: hypothetical protein CVU29_01405 [Betaproteobacteria bacterium HGW-Betaproteobacteria-22]